MRLLSDEIKGFRSDEGYMIVPILTADECDAARKSLAAVIAQQHDPLDTVCAHNRLPFVEQRADALISRIGFPGAYLMGTVCVNKQPREPGRPWHDDWRWWHLPVSQRVEPVQLGVIVYFRDAMPQNGRLRLVPGSHLAPPDERGAIDPFILAGDAVVIDSRLWHATYPNDTDEHREAVNFWYQVDPAFDREQPMGAKRKAVVTSS